MIGIRETSVFSPSALYYCPAQKSFAMKKLWPRTSQTVSPRPPETKFTLFGLVILMLTAGILYHWGYRRWTPTHSKPTYAAAAYVIDRRSDASEEKGAQSDSAHRHRIPLASTDADRRHAEEAANRLAEQYVADRQAEWKRANEIPRQKAREAVESAQREQAACQSRLEAFRKKLADTSHATIAVESPVVIEPKSTIKSDNPQWIELNRQLEDLRQRRTTLLVDRTPLHPAVQDVAMQIADLERRMTTIPRQIAQPELPKKTKPIAVTSPSDRQIKEAQARMLNELTFAWQQACETTLRAENAERQIVRQPSHEPQYTIVYARSVEVLPAADDGRQRLLTTTLMIGALGLVAIGILSLGTRIEPPLGSVAEAQACVGVPIVGLVPAEEPAAYSPALSRRRLRVRQLLLTAGSLCMAACPLMALWGVLGFLK
jgi:hypothetical protein